MPIYEYVCLKCKKEQEIMQKFSDNPLSTCPECGGELKKLISSTSFVLKGTGWYATDYGSKKKKKSDKKSEKKDKKKSADSKRERKEKKAEPARAE